MFFTAGEGRKKILRARRPRFTASVRRAMRECYVEIEDDGTVWEEYPGGTCKAVPPRGEQVQVEKRQKTTHGGKWRQTRLDNMRGGVHDDGG